MSQSDDEVSIGWSIPKKSEQFVDPFLERVRAHGGGGMRARMCENQRASTAIRRGQSNEWATQRRVERRE
jgi:hypothetical protein